MLFEKHAGHDTNCAVLIQQHHRQTTQTQHGTCNPAPSVRTCFVVHTRRASDASHVGACSIHQWWHQACTITTCGRVGDVVGHSDAGGIGADHGRPRAFDRHVVALVAHLNDF